MPFYDYRCKCCKKDFEILQSINDNPIKECPDCNGIVFRLITIPAKGQVDYVNTKELYEEKIKPEAKKIADKIRNGDEKAAADIFGEKKMFGGE